MPFACLVTFLYFTFDFTRRLNIDFNNLISTETYSGLIMKDRQTSPLDVILGITIEANIYKAKI